MYIIRAVILLSTVDQILTKSPLEYWLERIVIPINDKCFEYYRANFCIKKLTCSRIAVQTLKSNFIPPTTIEADFLGLQSICYGDWSYGLLSGSVSAYVKDTDISTSKSINIDNFYPSFVTSNSCSTKRISIHLHFTGSTSGYFLQAISTILDSYLEPEVAHQLCDVLGNKLTDSTTNLLQHVINPVVSAIISSRASSPSSSSSDYVDWSNHQMANIRAKIIDLLGMISSGRDITHDIVDYVTQGTGILTLDMRNMSVHLHANDLQYELHSPLAGAIRRMLLERIAAAHDSRLSNVTIYFHTISIDLSTAGEQPSVSLLRPSPTSNVSLVNILAFEDLGVHISATVEGSPADSSIKVTHLIEDFNLSLRFRNVTVEAVVQAAAVQDRWEALHLDQLTSSGGACLASTLDYVNLTSLTVNTSVASIAFLSNTPQSTGGVIDTLEVDLDAAINNVLLMVTTSLGSLLSATIRGLFQGPIRALVNRLLISALHLAKSPGICPNHIPTNVSEYLNWTLVYASPIVADILDQLRGSVDLIAISTGVVNALVGRFTDGRGAFRAPLGNCAAVLSGLDSFVSVSVQLPHHGGLPVDQAWYGLEAEAVLGRCLGSCHPASTSGNHSVQLSVLGREQQSLVSVNTTVDYMSLSSLWTLKFDRNTLLRLTAPELFKLSCILSPLHLVEVDRLRSDAKGVSVTVDGDDVGSHGEKIFMSLLRLGSGESALRGINAAVRRYLTDYTARCRPNVNSTTDESPGHSELPHKSSTRYAIFEFIFASLAFVTLVVIAWKGNVIPDCTFLTKYFVYDETRKGSDDKPLLLRREIPVFIRGAMVLLICCNVALILRSTFFVAGQVLVRLDTGTAGSGTSSSVFQFSLRETVSQMWSAGVYPLAVLIGFFSGVWPYMKLLLILLAIVLPNRVVSAKFRSSVLHWLNYLGKWSLIDVFVMVLTMTAFHLRLEVPSQGKLFVHVQPETGFYSFLVGTVLNMFLGHWVHRLHEKCFGGRPTASYPRDDRRSTPDPLRSLKLVQAGSISGRLKASSAVDSISVGFFVMSVLLWTMFVLLVAGTTLVVFKFEFRGLVAWLLGQDRVVSHSVLSVAAALPGAPGLPLSSVWGVVVISVAYLLFGMVCPVLNAALLLVLWHIPLPVHHQRRLLYCTRLLHTCASLDVFVVAVATALLQVQRLSAYIVGESCQDVNAMLSRLPARLLYGECRCFDLVASIDPTFWVTITAAGSLLLVSPLVSGLMDRIIQDRESCTLKSQHTVGNEADNGEQHNSLGRYAIAGDEDCLYTELADGDGDDDADTGDAT